MIVWSLDHWTIGEFSLYSRLYGTWRLTKVSYKLLFKISEVYKSRFQNVDRARQRPFRWKFQGFQAKG